MLRICGLIANLIVTKNDQKVFSKYTNWKEAESQKRKVSKYKIFAAINGVLCIIDDVFYGGW